MCLYARDTEIAWYAAHPSIHPPTHTPADALAHPLTRSQSLSHSGFSAEIASGGFILEEFFDGLEVRQGDGGGYYIESIY